jgi:hypothetical protein
MFILELIPLPWNVSLIILDFVIFFTALVFYQSWYLFKINVWYADFAYQLSVRMILQYDRTCAFLLNQWFDTFLLFALAPIFVLTMIGDALWYDTYNSRAVTKEILEYTHTCNIDYYNEGSYKGQGTPCYADDPRFDNGIFTEVP